jgi:hypothetical protein
MVCKPEMDLQAIFSRDMGYVFSAFFVRKIYGKLQVEFEQL